LTTKDKLIKAKIERIKELQKLIDENLEIITYCLMEEK